ncbi:hypothetical protein ACDW34_08615 [Acinetobacter piscicola]|uniref:hypothetical protein n=1 Tax=Acinetobacter piscicola TaxID=2006115 RepID=UPI003557C389
MNISLRAFWSNDPLPVQEKIKNPDCVIDLTFGNVLTLTTGVRSINNKTGDVILNAIDVGADSVGAARNVYDELSPKVDALIDNKLDKIDYVQHFRGLFSSYSALKSALTTALDGDYAHIDSGSGFDRMCAIWDSDDQKWKIIETNITANTDEMPEGSSNLYFRSERVRQTILTGLTNQTATDILATDSILTALAKLQAQMKVPSKVKWYKADEVGEIPIGTIIPSVVLNDITINFEFSKIQGLLWARGGFTPISKIDADVRILILKPEWKVQGLRIGQLINSPLNINMFNALSPSSESAIYTYSNGIVTNQEFSAEQSIRVRYFMGAGNWVVGNNGCVCLGALLTP